MISSLENFNNFKSSLKVKVKEMRLFSKNLPFLFEKFKKKIYIQNQNPIFPVYFDQRNSSNIFLDRFYEKITYETKPPRNSDSTSRLPTLPRTRVMVGR